MFKSIHHLKSFLELVESFLKRHDSTEDYNNFLDKMATYVRLHIKG